jgi:hypothetical protein
MEQTVFVILFLVVLVVIFKLFLNSSEDFAGTITQFMSTGDEDIYLNVGIDRYVPEYWNNYGYPCLSPYCRRRSWWYNRYTPLPWNNPTRYPKWPYPPYTYMTNYYRDSYAYPTFY